MMTLARRRIARQVVWLMSRDLDGVRPYLDPLEPMGAGHLARGAKRLGMEEAALRELVASSEEMLGWNPLQGGGRASESDGE